MNREKLTESLRAHGFGVRYFETSAQATQFLQETLHGKTIGIGGSETVRQMGLDRALAQDNTVYWHWDAQQVQQHGGAGAVRDLAAQAEVYLCSANAVAETGELVNIDGTGNRIAATAYGHQQVFFVVGVNKVTETLERAMWRARNVAAPKNARRLNRKTPCAQLADRCYDCSSPERICNGFLILARPMTGCDMSVILIGEELGA